MSPRGYLLGEWVKEFESKRIQDGKATALYLGRTSACPEAPSGSALGREAREKGGNSAFLTSGPECSGNRLEPFRLPLWIICFHLMLLGEIKAIGKHAGAAEFCDR
jgi:hypothetical protein